MADKKDTCSCDHAAEGGKWDRDHCLKCGKKRG